MISPDRVKKTLIFTGHQGRETHWLRHKTCTQGLKKLNWVIVWLSQICLGSTWVTVWPADPRSPCVFRTTRNKKDRRNGVSKHPIGSPSVRVTVSDVLCSEETPQKKTDFPQKQDSKDPIGSPSVRETVSDFLCSEEQNKNKTKSARKREKTLTVSGTSEDSRASEDATGSPSGCVVLFTQLGHRLSGRPCLNFCVQKNKAKNQQHPQSKASKDPIGAPSVRETVSDLLCSEEQRRKTTKYPQKQGFQGPKGTKPPQKKEGTDSHFGPGNSNREHGAQLSHRPYRNKHTQICTLSLGMTAL